MRHTGGCLLYTSLAKGGGETEKQIYRFQKGDADLALRFDLTVPLAKYVALHGGELSFPFRRYQIGKMCIRDSRRGWVRASAWPPVAPTAWWSSPPPTPPPCGTPSTQMCIRDSVVPVSHF